MAKDYRQIYKEKPSRTEDMLNKWKDKDGIEPQTIRQNISKINSSIKEHLNNETLLPYYQIASVRKYAGSRYGVRAEKGKIRIE
jgi:hypothetical protein